MRLSPDVAHELHPIEEIMSKEEQTATYRMPTFTDRSQSNHFDVGGGGNEL